MNRWIKISITLAMLIAMCTVDVCAATAQAESANYVQIDNEQITLAKAQELALAHAVGVAQQDPSCVWNQGFCIKSSKMLFHQNETVSAYLIRIKLLDDTAAGYVLINANENEYPIIEYATSGECFLDNAIEKTEDVVESETGQKVQKDNSKIYYFGDQTYVAQYKLNNNKYVTYDISTSEVEKVEKKEYTDDNDTKYITRQEVKERNSAYKALETTYEGKSNPPEKSGVIITDPSQYESGWISCPSPKYLKNWDLNYFSMDMFADGSNCSPTAAVNYFYYLYYNNPLYKNIMYHDWNSTYALLFKYMKTSLEDGTDSSNIVPGLVKYVKKRGYSVFDAKRIFTNAAKVMTEIDLGRPVLLSLKETKCYGNHTVVALGYDTFKYANGYISRYIRIADGWSTKANRFIWGDADGYWNRTVLAIK